MIDELRELIERCERQAAAARVLLEALVDEPSSSGGGETAPEQPTEEFRCHCGRTFTRQQGLTRHRNHCDGTPAASDTPSPATVEPGRLVCDDCDHLADTPTSMARHTFAEHGRRPSREERTPQVAA